MIFKKNDKVKCAFFGDEVFELEEGDEFVYFSHSKGTSSFLKDGRASDSHTHPVLTLVERPKKKKKVELWQWVFEDKYEERWSSATWMQEWEAGEVAEERGFKILGLDPNCVKPLVIEVDDD